jgi:hypothetical protein
MIIFEAEVIRAPMQGNLCVILRVSWKNFGERRSLHEFIFKLETQRTAGAGRTGRPQHGVARWAVEKAV